MFVIFCIVFKKVVFPSSSRTSVLINKHNIDYPPSEIEIFISKPMILSRMLNLFRGCLDVHFERDYLIHYSASGNCL